MTTEILEIATVLPVAKFNVNDAEIAALAERVQGRTADTPDGYKLVMAGLSDCRKIRVAVEKRRKELKADAIKWGKSVESEANRLKSLVIDIEEPLKASREEADQRQREIEEAELRAAEEAKRIKEEQERLKRKAEEIAERAERQKKHEAEMERERKAMQQAAEADRIAREKHEEEMRLVREEVEAEQREAAAARAEAQAILDKQREAREAEEEKERQEIARREQQARDIQDKEEWERVKPELELIDNYCQHVLQVVPYQLSTERGQSIMAEIHGDVVAACAILQEHLPSE